MDRPMGTPAEQEPPSLMGLAPAQRVAVWLDLLDSGERLVLAGLRSRLPPGGDLNAAYRQWCEDRAAERDAEKIDAWRRLGLALRSDDAR